MTAELYEKISKPFRKNEKTVKAINIINRILTLVVYASYPSLLCYVFLIEREKSVKTVFVPAIMLVAVSVLRKIINRKRPYVALNIEPIIKKDKQGESMPSRHIFSVFMIAMAFMYVEPLWSVPLFAVGVILGVIRIIGGVHYPSDIFVGALIGIVSGIIGFFVI